MEQVQKVVSLPAGSAALADGVAKLFKAVVANHKAGGGAIVELSADVMEAVKDLGPVMKDVGLLDDEAKADGLGVAEAFVLAGIEVARGN